MAFLHSIFLVALGAAAVPLLIHLFSRQKVRTIPFSSLDFLKLLQRQKMRKVRLRQLLLLILRTLIVLLVVLAFARPALKGVFSAGLSSQARTSAVILLDHSLSMGLRTPRGLLFEQAKEKAREVVSLLREGDEVWFVLLSDRPRLVQHAQDFSGLKRAIDEAGLSNGSTNVRSGLLTAADLLSSSRNANKEVYLITDLRRNGWAELADGKPVPFDERTTLFLLSVQGSDGRTVSVDDLEFLDRLLETGKSTNIQAAVSNHTDRKWESLVASLYVDGKRVAQTDLDLEPGLKAMADFAAVFDRPGLVSGYVEIEADDLPADDRRYFSIRIPEKIKVLIVNRIESEAYHLQLALNPSGSSQSLILPTVTTVDRLSQYNLSDFDVVLLSNVPRLSETQLSRLQSSVESGTGCIILLGNDIDPRFYNAELLPALCPALLRAPVGSSTDQSSFLSFGAINYSHPIFKGLLSDKSKFESPHFYLSYDMQLAPTTEPVISYGNGRAALAEGRKGSGTVMLFSTAADPAWTNLWRTGIYVPLLYRVVQYLATDLVSLEEKNLVGTVVEKEVGSIRLGQQAVCREPDGDEQAVELKSVGGRLMFRYDHTEETGVYDLLVGREPMLGFAVNPDPVESDMGRIDPGQVKELLKNERVHVLDADANVESSVLATRYGREMWRYCLLAALALMCAEMLIARERKQNKPAEE